MKLRKMGSLMGQHHSYTGTQHTRSCQAGAFRTCVAWHRSFEVAIQASTHLHLRLRCVVAIKPQLLFEGR